MVRLNHIIIEGNIAKCEIIPEASKEAGNIVVDLSSGEFIECNLPKGYEKCIGHACHAKYSLMELAASGEEIPKSRLVMWY